MSSIENFNNTYRDSSLVPLSEEYLELIFKWRNSSRVRENMFNSTELKWEDHLQWFDNLKKQENKFHYVFLHNKTPKGFLSFHRAHEIENSLNWGFYLGNSNEKKGLSYLMGMLGLDLAFNIIKVNEIYAQVLENNFKSFRYHLQLGFNLESKELYSKNEKNYYLFKYNKNNWEFKRNMIEENLKELFNEIFLYRK
ncbi:UDP-4-amino-4,6-dideoxy-N-acetyl-beta-L-altrosamine N-acetyltransferase [Silvanigrella sp.]|uniref:UDP-4-amino-4, 6-dideoxy-N-acetyl-beta-L-altrosamine N-acetyltransferase n=1 Tax=Silvanigrella sp. TaxID=2024976 RepID=UPI0037C7F18C